MLKTSIVAIAAGLSLLAGSAATAPSDQVTVATGALKGVVNGDVVAFKGIPFAAPPVGDLRWRAPQPPASWNGVRDAASFGPACMQDLQGFDMGALSEDCLTLNVWAPANPAAKHLPVMVWIFGGGHTNGSGSFPFYDGSNFARDGVILVTLNYRLGRLGWFAHPALTREGAGPLGNYGMMDQMAALKWVQGNIAAFGGDPKNVTIFGESAGGVSVNVLVTSPAGRGLFTKAISESGFPRFPIPTLAQEEQISADYTKTLGITGDDAAALKALRALPAEALLYKMAGADAPVSKHNGLERPQPMIDGTLIVDQMDATFRKGHENRVPYMVGGNSWEASVSGRSVAANPDQVLPPAGPDRDKILTMFGDGHDPVKAAYGYGTDAGATEPDRYVARKHAEAGVPSFLYFFSYVPAAQRQTVPGAAHGAEIVYAFDNMSPESRRVGSFVIPAATAEDMAMAKAMHAYWVAFAKTGQPDSAGGPLWAAYNPEKDNLLEFGNDGVEVRYQFRKARLDMIEGTCSQRIHCPVKETAAKQ
jgi:para-nitrobenzyl esterase